jgi:hypothetical protein
MTDSFTVMTPGELVNLIKSKLESQPHKSNYHDFELAPIPINPAVYALILGAGFSCKQNYDDDVGVPLVDELMKLTIGDYYYPDLDQSSMKRDPGVLRRHSADFWKEFNEAAAKAKLPTVEVDDEGLPVSSGAAYQYLFSYQVANTLFRAEKTSLSWAEQLIQERFPNQPVTNEETEENNRGELFLKGFLRYVLSPGAEHGYGATGRIRLNAAHIYLAGLLEAQQLGDGWGTRAFCRTLFTTNFDTLLQNCLQMVNLLYRITDRPEKGLDRSDFFAEEGPIHLVYIHGSILRYNPASSISELEILENTNIEVLREYLESRDVIIIGYSGWKDVLMAALRQCDHSKHQVYWCDIRPQPAPHVAAFLLECGDNGKYVRLGKSGADGLMCDLYESLVPVESRRDPIERYVLWRNLIWK